QNHELGQRRYGAGAPGLWPAAEILDQRRREEERETFVAVHVVVRADIFGAGIADDRAPGDELERAAPAVIAEAARPHIGDRIGIVRLGEWGRARRHRAPV